MMVGRFLLVIVIVRCVSYMQRMELMQIRCRGNILTIISTIHFHSFHSVPYFINFQYHCGIFDTSHTYLPCGMLEGVKRVDEWKLIPDFIQHPSPKFDVFFLIVILYQGNTTIYISLMIKWGNWAKYDTRGLFSQE